MLIKSENHSHFKRKDNVLTEVLNTGAEIPVFSFKQKFIDVDRLNETTIEYCNRYASMFPHLVEKIDVSPQTELSQLTLF